MSQARTVCYFPALRFVCLGAVALHTLALASAADPSSVTALRRVAREPSALEADLHRLCDIIGPRPAGTPAMRAALDWALDEFELAGLTNPHLEPVAIPRSWTEGETRIEVLTPAQFGLRGASTALSPPIADPLQAEVVLVGTGSGYSATRASRDLSGKVALISLDVVSSFQDLGESQRDALEAMRAAAASDVEAVLFISNRTNQVLYRHLHSLTGDLDPVPSAVVARDEGLRLLRLLEAGDRVQVRVHLPNRIGPAFETANAVADIEGSELPGEIVLIGAHLDSWDMGTGCLDNAVNAALVMHVARSVQASGVRPARTLRFVLFGGEELGLHGSRAYATRHAGQMGDHVATFIHDMGAGPLVGYSTGGRNDLLPTLDRLLAMASPDRHLRNTAEAYYISDNVAFLLRGVPSLFAVQDTVDYVVPYHYVADTLDNVSVGDVADTAATAAALVLGVADMDGRMGPRLDSGEVLAWLRQEGLVRHFRFLGVWETWWPK